MTIYFQAAEVEDWPTTSGTVTQTASAVPDSRGWIRTGVNGAAEDTHYVESGSFATGTEIWTHLYIGQFSSVGFGTWKFLKLYSGGTVRFGLALITNNGTSYNLGVYKWNGSSWDLLGTSDYLFTEAGAYFLDLYIKLGNPGRVSLYLNSYGLPIISVGGLDLSFVSSLDKIRLQASGSSSNWQVAYRECIVADFNTVGSRVRVKSPDANGTYTAWTTGAAFGNIDEVVPAADFASSGTADQRFSFTSGDFSALGTNEVIENLRLSYLANRDAAGPQNINAFLRISGTDYDAADQTLDVTATRRQRDWLTNPATAAAWASAAAVNAVETGLRSRT